MKSVNLLEGLHFDEKGPHAEPLHADRNGRAILFSLKPGQAIKEHNAPSSPFYAVVIRGRGVFAGGDGVEHTVGPNTLLIFDPGEQHMIQAVEALAFIGFLHGVPHTAAIEP
jgi:quercetin dioxygenase-like cupin family protein